MSATEPNFFGGSTTPRESFLNPLVSRVGDFTPFYIAIAICTTILGSILILNIICCYSRYSEYWLNRHTGNRWLVSIWSTTPHKQPPLDLTELNPDFTPIVIPRPYEDYPKEIVPSVSQQPLHTSQEYLELQKRESDL